MSDTKPNNETSKPEGVKSNMFFNSLIIKRVVIWTGFVALLVFGFVQLTEYLAGSLLKEQITEHTHGEYGLTFNKLSINWLEQDINLSNAHYYRVNKVELSDSISSYDLKVNRLNINLKSIIAIYFERSIKIKNVNISYPEVAILQNNHPKRKKAFSLNTGDLYKVVEGFVKSFQIDNLSVNHMKLDYMQPDKMGDNHFLVSDLSFNIRNFQIDSAKVSKNEDFFFTESFELSLVNQSIEIGDGRHELHLDSLKLSTMDNNIQVYNTTIKTLDSTLNTDVKNLNEYSVDIPYMGLIGLNFMLAYQENVISIDSCILDRPNISAKVNSLEKKGQKLKNDTAVENRMSALILHVFDSILLDQFHLNNAKLYGEYKSGEKGEISNVNIEFTKYVLDYNDLKPETYYPNFEGLKLSLQTPHFNLPGGVELNANILKFSTFDSVLTIDDVVLINSSKELNKDTKVSVKQIFINGINPKEIITKNKLRLQELTFVNPHITLDQRGVKGAEIDLEKFITPQISMYSIQKVGIENGSLRLINSHNGKQKANRIDLTLRGFELSKQSLEKSTFLLSRSAYLRIHKPEFYIPEIQHNIEARDVVVNTKNGLADISNLKLSPAINDSSLVNNIMNIQLSKLQLKGVDFAHLKEPKKVNLTMVDLNSGVIRVNQLRKDTSNNNNFSDFLRKLESFDIHNLRIRGVDVVFKKQDTSNVMFTNGFVGAKLLSAHQDRLKEGQLSFFDDSLTYGAEGFFAPLNKINHILTLEKVLRSHDSTLTISGLAVRPIPNRVTSDSDFVARGFIPEIVVTGMHSFESRYTDSLNLGVVHINNPKINIKLPKSSNSSTKTTLSSHLSSSFLDGAFTMIGVEGFHIKNGAIEIKQIKNDGDIFIKTGELNLHSSNWAISKESKWQESKFLWADDFSVQLNKLGYEIPGIDFCHNIDSLSYSFNPNELTVHGIYFSSQADFMESNKTGVSLFTPYLKLIKPSLYRYLSDSVIAIDKIYTEGGVVEADVFTKSDTSSLKKFVLPSKIPDTMNGVKAVEIGKIALLNMDMQSRIHHKKYTSPLDIDQFSMQIDSVKFSPGDTANAEHVLWADNIELNMHNIYTTVDEGLYEIGADTIHISTKEKVIDIDNVGLIPTVYRYEYALHKGYAKDVFTVNSPNLNIKGFDFHSVLYTGKVRGSVINVISPNLDILKDKRVNEPAYKYKDVIPKIFKDLPVSLTFDSIAVSDMKIRYEEFAKNGKVPGDIELTHMDIIARNVTNDSIELRKDSILDIDMTSMFLDTSLLTLDLDYNLLSPYTSFNMSTTLDPLDATLINGFIEPVFFAKIRTGNVISMDMSVIGNDTMAGGLMGLYYTDLKFSFLNEKVDDKKMWFKSLAGNTVISTKNKYHPFKRRAPLYFERDTNKGWINYLIKIELTGISSSVGYKKYKKDLKKMDKEMWKMFEKNDKKVRKQRVKEEKLARKKARKNKELAD